MESSLQAFSVPSCRKACRCSPGRNLKNRDMDCRSTVLIVQVRSCQKVPQIIEPRDLPVSSIQAAVSIACCGHLGPQGPLQDRFGQFFGQTVFPDDISGSCSRSAVDRLAFCRLPWGLVFSSSHWPFTQSYLHPPPQPLRRPRQPLPQSSRYGL